MNQTINMELEQKKRFRQQASEFIHHNKMRQADQMHVCEDYQRLGSEDELDV